MREKQKVFVRMFLISILLVSVVVPAFAQPDDIRGHWSAIQVNEWIGKGLINGYEDGSFKPDISITRAEFIAVASRAFGFSEKAAINFSDIPAEAWFKEEIAKAIAAGYISGYEDGTMKPDNPITRVEAAKVLFVLMKVNASGELSSINQFKDASDIPEWGKEFFNAVVAEKYFQGYADSTVKPLNPITRAEAVSVLSRAAGSIFNIAEVYGPEKDTETIAGNVTISSADVNLKNTEIDGNLYLVAGIGDGNVQLDNITVTGRTLISGGGLHSVIVNNSALGEVLVDKKNGEAPRIVAQGTSSFGTVSLNSAAQLAEKDLTGAGFSSVQVSSAFNSNKGLVLAGDFDVIIHALVNVDITKGNVTLEISQEASGTTVALGKEAVLKKIIANAPVEVKGEGSVERAEINIAGVVIQQEAKEVVVKEGVNAFIGGQIVDKSNVQPSGGSSASSQTWTGWIIDKDCVGVNPINHTKSCNLMDSCYNNGLGLVVYVPGNAYTAYQSDVYPDYLIFDAESKELAKDFLDNLPSTWVKNITVEVTGYVVSDIPANADESQVPETDQSAVDHYLKGIHVKSIEAACIDGVSTNALPSSGGGGGSTTDSSLKITTASLEDGTVGIAYNITLAATGGTSPYTWAAAGLPDGLSIDTVNGTVYGTPSVTDTFTVHIAVTDSESTSVGADLQLLINPASPEVQTWIKRTSGTIQYLSNVYYGNGIFVAVAANGTILTSNDGINWSSQSSGTTKTLKGITYGNGIFVAVGYNGIILTSNDGINWSSQSSGTTDSTGITYGDGIFVVVGGSGTIMTSIDGISWIIQSSGTTKTLKGITYGNGIFVAVGYNGIILTSNDGISWTSQSSGMTNSLTGITYGDGTFMAVEGSGTILTSIDGISWASHNSGTTEWFTGISYGGGIFVVVGGNVTILTSNDGINWTRRHSGMTDSLLGITYGNGTFVAVGESGIIFQSGDENPEPVVLNSIAIGIQANKLNYTVGDTLDITGLQIIGTYSDNSTAVLPITAANVTGFDSSKPATGQVLIITAEGKTATYTIDVYAAGTTPENPVVQTFTGYIEDEDCYVYFSDPNNNTNPGEDSKGCLKMISCAASGFGIAVPQSDGTYKYYYFDGTFAESKANTFTGNGSQLVAWNLILNTIKQDHVSITVTGTLTGDTKISPYNDISYPVITVSSLSEIDTEAAVVAAEASHTQADVDAARAFVNALPDGADKIQLSTRLDAVQQIIDATNLQTLTGWFKDRHCKPTSGTTLTGSCSVACGTGGPAGTAMLNGCQARGHGIWLNPTEDNQSGEYLTFDAESAELLKAFLFQLHDHLNDATTPNDKLSLAVTGYRVDNIPANADESIAPYLDGEADHYIGGFHVLSVRGVIISENSYPGFAENDYELTLEALVPQNVTAEVTASGISLSFDAPISAASKSPKFGVKGYRVNVYAGDDVVKTMEVNNNPETPLSHILIEGLEDGKYTFTVTALYTASKVESAESEASEAVIPAQTLIGWILDRDCIGVNPLNHSKNCNLMGANDSPPTGCYASGLGLYLYGTGGSTTASDLEHYKVFDAESKILAKTFLLSLPDTWKKNITVKITGYNVSGIPVNADETQVPEIDPAQVSHYLDGFHINSIEAAYIDGVSTNPLPSPNIILPVPLSITTGSLENGTAGTAYSVTLTATGGTAPYTWAAAGLPDSLSIDTVNGTVYGTPTVAGTFTVHITVTDSKSGSVSTDLQLLINPESPDLQKWIKRTSGTIQTINNVYYGNGIFVALAENGTILTSGDGKTWSSQSSGTTNSLKSITYMARTHL
ncbi:MAG: Endo-1,4-beta-xylanase A precursor [Pelotomaculum sp. PtaU1.Bin035]|nr:MAG: Endo-1,4-beta-xylanase A precursor [Pelotomaculum sp. PtaU1.Bin035]